MADLVNMKY